MENLKCHGSCANTKHCTGEVKRVEVFDKRDDGSWGKFNYCETAIATDIKNGFRVVILEEE